MPKRAQHHQHQQQSQAVEHHEHQSGFCGFLRKRTCSRASIITSSHKVLFWRWRHIRHASWASAGILVATMGSRASIMSISRDCFPMMSKRARILSSSCNGQSSEASPASARIQENEHHKRQPQNAVILRPGEHHEHQPGFCFQRCRILFSAMPRRTRNLSMSCTRGIFTTMAKSGELHKHQP